MLKLPWLDEQELSYPDTKEALTAPNGLLAAGGALTFEWLQAAYQKGIFPWFSDGEPILWWTPSPRAVLYPKNIRINRTLKREIRKSSHLSLRYDQAFEQVIEECANRRSEDGTWITEEMKLAYINAHQKGLAHSIEIWDKDNLVGGLYGIAMGNVFFGESMFSRVQSASKIALVSFIKTQPNLSLLDCQMTSAHLTSLGAIEISRYHFEQHLDSHISCPTQDQFNWKQELPLGELLNE